MTVITTPAAKTGGRRDPLPGVLAFVGKYGTICVLLAMVVGFSLAAPNSFATTSNATNVLSQLSLTAIVAGGLTLVLVVGEFDLSIGYQASLAGVLVVGLMARQELAAPVAIAIVLVVAVIIGIVNGLVVTKLGVNSMIATLGTGTVVVGINYWYANGIPIALIGTKADFSDVALGHAILGIPNPIVFMAVILAGLWVLLNQTSIGQHMQAVGGNREAATLSGIRSDRTIIAAFAVTAIFGAVAGMLLASRIGSGQINAGDGYMLDAFAAVFLGSAALRDGQFHIVGTLIGVLTVSVGFNGLAILGEPTFIQFLFKGIMLILAVALSTVARRYARR
jgi:ribose transport system permease protein